MNATRLRRCGSGGMLLVGCLLSATGCLHRQFTIRSEPSGAQILVNDKILGLTPYSYDFQWYGWYRLSLVKPGYERLDDHVLIRAPTYLWIPFDLLAELAPFAVHDDKVLSYQLQIQTPIPEPAPPVIEPEPVNPAPLQKGGVKKPLPPASPAAQSPVVPPTNTSSTQPNEASDGHSR